jgi:hypothetical protein
MANYAVLVNGVVDNIIVADTQEIAEAVTQKTCVEVNEEIAVNIGWTYDGTTFIAPKEITESTDSEAPTE